MTSVYDSGSVTVKSDFSGLTLVRRTLGERIDPLGRCLNDLLFASCGSKRIALAVI